MVGRTPEIKYVEIGVDGAEVGWLETGCRRSRTASHGATEVALVGDKVYADSERFLEHH